MNVSEDIDINWRGGYNLSVLFKNPRFKKMASLEQKIQAKMDELNALKEKQRKKENQEKIIIGALVIKEAQTNPEFAKHLMSIISKASERDRKKIDAVTKNFARPAPNTTPIKTDALGVPLNEDGTLDLSILEKPFPV